MRKWPLAAGALAGAAPAGRSTTGRRRSPRVSARPSSARPGRQAPGAHVRRRAEHRLDAGTPRGARQARREGDVLQHRPLRTRAASAAARGGRSRARDRKPHLFACRDAVPYGRDAPPRASHGDRGDRGRRRRDGAGAGKAPDAAPVGPEAPGHAAAAPRGGLRPYRLVGDALGLEQGRHHGEDHGEGRAADPRAGTSSSCTTGATSRWAGTAATRSKATELILTQWKDQQGFEFVTIPEMIEATGFVVP